MKHICIVCSAKLPQPPSKGGAVPVLIDEISSNNNIKKKLKITYISLYDVEAEKMSIKYDPVYNAFIYVKPSKFSCAIDKIISKLISIFRLSNKQHSFGNLAKTISFAHKVRKKINNGFDYLIFENSVVVLNNVLRSRRIRRNYAKKIFYHAHAVPRKIPGLVKSFALCKSVICVSEYIARIIKKEFSVKSYLINTTVLYNGVNTSLFKPNKHIEFYNMFSVSKPLVVGFVGRICKEKGIFELVKAIQLLNRDDIKLVIVGSNFYGSISSDSFLETLKEECLKIKDKIEFAGYVKNEDMPLVYNQWHISCFPAVWEEPAGMTNIESSACGTPVISTISGGNVEYISKDNAIYISKDNQTTLIENIAEVLANIMGNPKMLVELSNKCYQNSQVFSDEIYFDNFCKILF